MFALVGESVGDFDVRGLFRLSNIWSEISWEITV